MYVIFLEVRLKWWSYIIVLLFMNLLFSPFGNLMFDPALQLTVITPHAVSLSLSVFSTLLLCSLCPWWTWTISDSLLSCIHVLLFDSSYSYKNVVYYSVN